MLVSSLVRVGLGGEEEQDREARLPGAAGFGHWCVSNSHRRTKRLGQKCGELNLVALPFREKDLVPGDVPPV
jgi:hypothetical protein